MRVPAVVSRVLGRLGVRHAPRPEVRPVLPVRDLDRAQRDHEALGLEVRRWDDGYAWVHHDGHEVWHLKVVDDLDPAANHAEVHVLVDDVDHWHDRAAAAGLAPTPVQSMPWGLRESSFTDDSGNRVRFGNPDTP